MRSNATKTPYLVETVVSGKSKSLSSSQLLHVNAKTTLSTNTVHSPSVCVLLDETQLLPL